MIAALRGVGALAGYQRVVGDTPYAASFNPTVAGRRTYNSVGSFAGPNFIDTPGWAAFAAGGPLPSLIAAGYTLQLRVTYDRFEGMNGSFANHTHALTIGGVEIHDSINNPASGFFDTGYFNVSSAASGAITFRDWLNNANGISGTSFVGNVTLYYRYIRT